MTKRPKGLQEQACTNCGENFRLVPVNRLSRVWFCQTCTEEPKPPVTDIEFFYISSTGLGEYWVYTFVDDLPTFIGRVKEFGTFIGWGYQTIKQFKTDSSKWTDSDNPFSNCDLAALVLSQSASNSSSFELCDVSKPLSEY